MNVPTELADALRDGRSELHDAHAVLLPDLFLDLLIPLPGRDALDQDLDRLIDQGGGNLLTPHQRIHLGGNAANTAHALASLGVPSTLIAPTNHLGRALFQQAMDGLPATQDALVPTQEAACTVALELDADEANVMLSNPGPLRDFGPADLDEEAWALIDDADILAITNWSQTLEHGTQLLDTVAARAKRNGAFTFLDTGDPAHRGQDIQALLTDPTPLEHVSAWGMNEHEARFFAKTLQGSKPPEALTDVAALLDEHVPPRIDVHTETQAFSLHEGDRQATEAFNVAPQHRTGAGDAWNAGNLAGDLLGLEARPRMTLANAVAALTITNPANEPVKLDDVATFLATPDAAIQGQM